MCSVIIHTIKLVYAAFKKLRTQGWIQRCKNTTSAIIKIYTTVSMVSHTLSYIIEPCGKRCCSKWYQQLWNMVINLSLSATIRTTESVLDLKPKMETL